MKHFKSCDWLLAHLDKVVILDAGIVKAGTAGPYEPGAMLPGAQRFDFGKTFAKPQAAISNTMCDAEQFQREARALGINQNDTVIVYDVQGLYASARAWWMFKAMGFDEVYILDGGLNQWQAKGYPVQAGYSNASLQGDFIAKPRENYFIDKYTVLNAIDSAAHLILDARGFKRFTGEEKEPRAGMRSGHIPSSQSFSYSLVSDEQGLVKSADELSKLFQARGAEDKALIFSCGSGVTACVLAVAASESGYNDLHVYDGSWSEWGADVTLPIATGKA